MGYAAGRAVDRQASHWDKLQVTCCMFSGFRLQDWLLILAVILWSFVQAVPSRHLFT
jgi:hypothetical protein